jgi:hypothetical protein
MTVDAFIQAACVPRHSSHSSGTLEEAEVILARYPEVAAANVYTAAILADEEGVRGFLQRDPQSATAKGGPHGWDALSYLCFSRYLRLDRTRSEAFVRTARILLDAGASANTGWIEMIDHPTPRPIVENAIYGAAAIARHPELTRLLLEYGADPNDGETAYHLPEGYDNTVLKILLGSRRFNHASLACLLARKADWHDHAGMHLVLEHGGDPNFQRESGNSPLQQALQRDNALSTIEMLLDYGADPTIKSNGDGKSASILAARRGRGDVLSVLEQRGFRPDFHGVDRLIAACAQGNREGIRSVIEREPELVTEVVGMGGTLLAELPEPVTLRVCAVCSTWE